MGAKKEFCYAVKTTDTQAQEEDATTCLLYTSDAADDAAIV